MRLILKEWLDSLGNVAAVLICIAVLTSAAAQYIGSSGNFKSGTVPGVAVGDDLAALPGFSYGEAKVTVALFLHTRCVACIQSVPEYRQLAREIVGSNGRINVVGVFANESPEAIADYQSLGYGVFTSLR